MNNIRFLPTELESVIGNEKMEISLCMIGNNLQEICK
jgi:hypothetical protein